MELKFLIIIATNDSTVSHHSSVFVNLTCITLQICDEKYKFINVNAHHGGEGELPLLKVWFRFGGRGVDGLNVALAFFCCSTF